MAKDVKVEAGTSATKILQCKCESAWQDKQYGKGLRVHNLCKGKGGYRCTVCGSNR